MSRQESRRGVSMAALATVLVIVAVWVLVAWLRATAPAADTSAATVPEAAPDPEEVLLCEDLQSDLRDDAPVGGRAFSGEILECPTDFDGRRVSYVGEVVGDVLERDGGAWVLVNDDAYALVHGPLGASRVQSGTNSGVSVWLPTPEDAVVSTPGRAGVRGDVISVLGTVHHVDPDDGGGLTIRADEVVLLAPAVELDVPVHWRQLYVALALAVIAGILTVRDRRERRR